MKNIDTYNIYSDGIITSANTSIENPIQNEIQEADKAIPNRRYFMIGGFIFYYKFTYSNKKFFYEDIIVESSIMPNRWHFEKMIEERIKNKYSFVEKIVINSINITSINEFSKEDFELLNHK